MSVEIAEAFVRIRPDLTGFRSELIADLEADLRGVDGKVRVDLDDSAVAGRLAEVSAQVAAARPGMHVGADVGAAWAAVTGFEAAVDGSTATVTVDANVGPAMKTVAELQAATRLLGMPRSWLDAVAITRGGVSNAQDYKTKSALIDALAAANSTDTGGSGLAGLLAGATAGAPSGGKPGLAALMANILVGHGFGKGGAAKWAGAGLFGALPAIGSIGAFAGLGAEHLIMSGVGLAGSAVGGLLGGALLGAGSLGVMGVGMGTDMAGIGQAVGDVRQYTTLQNNLSQAAAVYGTGSKQYALAQYQYQQWAQNLNAATIKALSNASNTAQQFHQLFDKATANAETTGAQILTQAMHVGEAFLPTIGRYAAQNMGIIQTSLQPLFSWLKNPAGGLGAFNELEHVFQVNLPTAMHAFDQGVELVMRTLAYLAPQTGGFLKTIDRIVTEFNGAGWTRWEVGIQKLIGDFRQWEGLIKILVADIYQLFHNDAGTGQAIVQTLTDMLTKLHAWETSTQGSAQLHNLFTAHKQELIDILKLLPTFISTFGQIEMAVAPALTGLVADLAHLADTLLHIPYAGPVLAWAAAIGILASKMNVIPMLKNLTSTISNLSAIIPALAGRQMTLNQAFSAFGQSKGGGLSGVAAAARNAAQEAQGLDTAMTDVATATGAAGTAASDASSLWVPMSARMSETAGAAEGLGAKVATAGEEAAVAAESGVGVLGAGIGGLLGPIGLAVGAIGVGLIPAFMGLLRSGPSAAQQTASAVQALDQQLAQIPVSNMYQMASALDQVSLKTQALAGSMQQLKPGSDALQVAGGKMSALDQYTLNTTTQMLTMNANLAVLGKTFGLTGSDVESFASQVGINLKQKLDPTQVSIFAQAVQNSGQKFNTAALQVPHLGDAVAANAQRMITTESQKNATITAAEQTHNALMVDLANKGGAAAIAGLANSTRGGLPQVEAVARQYGVTIPQRYLDALNAAMLSGGQVSMAKLAGGITSGLPLVGQSFAGLPGLARIELSGPLATAGLDAGLSLDSGLAAGIQADVGQVLGVTSMVAASVVGAMRKGLQVNSPSLIMMEIGHGVGEGLAAGIGRSTGLAAAAAEQMANQVTGRLSPLGSAGAFAAAGWQSVKPASPVVLTDQRQVHVTVGDVATMGKVAAAVNTALDAHDQQLLGTIRQLTGR